MFFSDIIYIHGLKIETVIGVYEWEKVIKQAVILDIEAKVDIKLAAKTENITDTLDYAELAVQVSNFVANKSFLLIETLAEEVAQLLLQESKIQHVRLSVCKPNAIPNAKAVGVIIERSLNN